MSKKLIMAAAAAAAADDNKNDDSLLLIPLRNWMYTEAAAAKKSNDDDKKLLYSQNNNDMKTCNCNSKESIIRKTTIAYGILELLTLFSKNNNRNEGKMTTTTTPDEDDEEMIQIDNFAVYVTKKSSQQQQQQQHHQPWDDIKGVSMISPALSLTIEEPAYLSCLLEPEEKHGQWGRYLEVERMISTLDVIQTDTFLTEAVAGEDCCDNDEDKNSRINHRWYFLVAKLLYEIFVHEVFPDDSSLTSTAAAATSNTTTAASIKEPAQKRAKTQDVSSRKSFMLSRAKGDFDKAEIMPFQIPPIVRMQKLGIPASLCLMTQNLLESASLMEDDDDDKDNGQSSSDDAYKSWTDVVEDLHLLLLDPDRFLFDNDVQSNEYIQLRYRKEKLYGRDKEETLITDAFCRVSRGKSEAFFIGGFSGSGKSMLVNSLRARVNVVGGYVITHKFDAVSQEKSLSGIIMAFNQLCLMLQARSTPQRLATLVEKLRDEFGADIVLLARILRNVNVLSSEFISPEAEEEGGVDTMNARSVGFTLSRFVRLVSSPKHPIMVSDYVC
jgi:hypothetical protein